MQSGANALRKSFAVGAVASLFFVGTGRPYFARQDAPTRRASSASLKVFVRAHFKADDDPDTEKTTRINVASVKTQDGGVEQVVYVSGPGWCGTGGCTLMIVEPRGASFRILGELTIVQLPVRVLPGMRHGHPDLGLIVAGGGIRPGYEAAISFDGRAYPHNPSLPPARPLRKVEGRVLIATTDDSMPLYD